MRAAVLIVLVAAVGCSNTRKDPDFQDLHPVKGIVKVGGKAATGGSITFAPDPASDDFIINSEVGSDGTFELSTVRLTDTKGERKDGAPAGKYWPTYTPALGEQEPGAITGSSTLPMAIAISGPELNLKLDMPAPEK